MPRARATTPSWDRLYENAAAQQGFFTTRQAAEAGYSGPLLFHHVRTGKLTRIRRGLYRLVHFPAGEHEDLVVAWLWSEQEGVISHQSALALHGLSDALPGKLHMTVPLAWQKRRLRLPRGIVLHHADVAPAERTWFGSAPATTPVRTLEDCARSGLSPELLRQAAREALERGLVRQRELRAVKDALKPFGGLDP